MNKEEVIAKAGVIRALHRHACGVIPKGIGRVHLLDLPHAEDQRPYYILNSDPSWKHADTFSW
jgi:hypothetical protein